MIDADKLRKLLFDDYAEIAFQYNGQKCGVILHEVNNYIPTYIGWYGDIEKKYHNVDELMSDPIYDGKSLKDLADKIEFDVY